MSSVLLFAGIYILLYRIDAQSFRGVDVLDSDVTNLNSALNYADVWTHFFYFSATVMSTGGSRADHSWLR